MLRSASVFLLILIAVLAVNTAPPNKLRKTIRVPLRLLERNTTSFPLDRRNKDLISLRSWEDTSYIGTIGIGSPSDGTPPKTYEMVFDTGSHLTWVADLTCKNCGQLPLYDGSKSKTFKDLESEFRLQYADGTEVLGKWTNDVYHFGDDIEFRHNFGRAEYVPNFNVREGSSGVVGLRLGKRPPYPTILRRIAALNLLDDDVFSCRFLKDNPTQAGDILFGDVDPTHVVGGLDGIQYVKVMGPDWRIAVDDVQIEGRSVAKGKAALVDTGASFIRLSGSAVEDLYTNTGAKYDPMAGWIVPDPFPFDVTFVIGQKQFTLPKSDIPLKNRPPIGNMYQAAIQVDNSITVLGIPFIKNQYVVFDFNVGKERIGIGKRTDYQPPESAMSSSNYTNSL